MPVRFYRSLYGNVQEKPVTAFFTSQNSNFKKLSSKVSTVLNNEIFN